MRWIGPIAFSLFIATMGIMGILTLVGTI